MNEKLNDSNEVDAPERPEQVAKFVEALIANAKLQWTDPEDESFVKSIPYAHFENGYWTVCDNYERFFSTIYTFRPDAELEDEGGGSWSIRRSYSDAPDMPYDFDRCMADASIMFTG